MYSADSYDFSYHIGGLLSSGYGHPDEPVHVYNRPVQFGAQTVSIVVCIASFPIYALQHGGRTTFTKRLIDAWRSDHFPIGAQSPVVNHLEIKVHELLVGARCTGQLWKQVTSCWRSGS